MIKMASQRHLKNGGRRRRMWLLLAALLGLLAPAAALASTLVSQTFTADSSLPVGAVVSLKNNTTDQVVGSTTNNSNAIFGVVVNPDSSQLSISSGQSNQVNVAQSGIEQVLVSDINGSISAGDSITASPISGVGMKATSNVKIVGLAQDNFPNSTAQNQTYTQNGQKHTVKIGQVPVLINVSYYYKQPDKTIIPQALQNIADSLAGKTVNTLPILISIGVFLVTMVVVMSIIYSMIRSSIISVGRNPMSQAAVYRNVLQLSALVIAILAVAVGSIYMVLTKF